MIDVYQLEILKATSSNMYSITELAEALNHSSRTIVKKVDRLIEMGYVFEIKTSKFGGGRAPKIVIPTKNGKELLSVCAIGEFTMMRNKYKKILAGPMLTLSKLGIDFLGNWDLFSTRHIPAEIFDVVICKDFMFNRSTIDDDFVYPNLNNMIIWLMESKRPRFVAIVPLLLEKMRDFKELKHLAKKMGAINTLNFLLDLAGRGEYADLELQSPQTEKMTDIDVGIEDDIMKLARKYNVINVPEISLFEEIRGLYGRKVVI